MTMTPKQVFNLFLLCKISAHCITLLLCFGFTPSVVTFPLANFLLTALHVHRFQRQVKYLNMPNLGGFLEAIGDFPIAPDAASTAPTSPLASPTDSPRIMKLFWKVSYCGKHEVPVFLRLTLSVVYAYFVRYIGPLSSSALTSDPTALRPGRWTEHPTATMEPRFCKVQAKKSDQTALSLQETNPDQTNNAKTYNHQRINNHEKPSIKDCQESSTTIKNHQEPSMIINNYQAPSTINKPQPWGETRSLLK